MKQTLTCGNESAETRGLELEKVYADLLGGRIVGGHNDGGMDIIFEDVPEVSFVQIKSSWPIAKKFLEDSVRLKEFLPIVVGDPGQYQREEIFQSIRDNGGWAGIDVENREKVIGQIKAVRDLIFSLGGRQRGPF